MITVTKTLMFASILFVMFSIDILNNIQSGVNFVNDAEAVRGRPGTPRSYAGVARRTTRRVVVGTTAVVTSAAATTDADSPDVVVVNQTPQATSQSGTAVPIGTTIMALPAGCSTVSATGGGTYFNCAGVYYQPSYQGNTLVYVVVPAP